MKISPLLSGAGEPGPLLAAGRAALEHAPDQPNADQTREREEDRNGSREDFPGHARRSRLRGVDRVRETGRRGVRAVRRESRKGTDAGKEREELFLESHFKDLSKVAFLGASSKRLANSLLLAVRR